MSVYLNFLPDLQIYTKWKQSDHSAECFTISNNSVNHSGYCKVQQNLEPRLQIVDEFFLIKAFKRPHNTFLSKKAYCSKSFFNKISDFTNSSTLFLLNQ